MFTVISHTQSSVMYDSCDPVDRGPPGSSDHGVSQARILEWLPFSPPGDPLDPGLEPASLVSPAMAGGFFTTASPLCTIYLAFTHAAQGAGVILRLTAGILFQMTKANNRGIL